MKEYFYGKGLFLKCMPTNSPQISYIGYINTKYRSHLTLITMKSVTSAQNIAEMIS